MLTKRGTQHAARRMRNCAHDGDPTGRAKDEPIGAIGVSPVNSVQTYVSFHAPACLACPERQGKPDSRIPMFRIRDSDTCPGLRALGARACRAFQPQTNTRHARAQMHSCSEQMACRVQTSACSAARPNQCSVQRSDARTQRKRERPCHHELGGTLREALHSPHGACAAKAGKVVWPAGCDKTSVLVGRRVLHGAFHALTRLAVAELLDSSLATRTFPDCKPVRPR